MKFGFLPIKKDAGIILAKPAVEKILFPDDSLAEMKLIAKQESAMAEQDIKLSGNAAAGWVHAV